MARRNFVLLNTYLDAGKPISAGCFLLSLFGIAADVHLTGMRPHAKFHWMKRFIWGSTWQTGLSDVKSICRRHQIITQAGLFERHCSAISMKQNGALGPSSSKASSRSDLTLNTSINRLHAAPDLQASDSPKNLFHHPPYCIPSSITQLSQPLLASNRKCLLQRSKPTAGPLYLSAPEPSLIPWGSLRRPPLTPFRTSSFLPETGL